MVSNKLLLYIHQRLVEIFGCLPDIPYAGVTVICSGDLYQLPINASSVYAPYESGKTALITKIIFLYMCKLRYQYVYL